MKETKKETCQHINIEREGLWDGMTKTGELTGGPMVYCADCGKTINMTWETFKSIPRKDKSNNNIY